MGLLKHFVFPALILLHTNVVFQGMLRVQSGGRLALIKQFEWEGAAEREALSTWEEHTLGIICGGHAAFLVAGVWSTLLDSSSCTWGGRCNGVDLVVVRRLRCATTWNAVRSGIHSGRCADCCFDCPYERAWIFHQG